jgi:hypothetical protein
MDRIVNIQNIDPTTLELQTYSSEDQSLISSFELENSFTSSVDYIEYTIYDFNQNLLLYIDRLPNYSIINNQIQIDPETDLLSYGFDEGQYITNYSFFKNILGSSNDNTYYISEISSDRTEIRLDTTLIDNNFVISSTNEFTIQLQQANYYKDFYLNFGNNNLVIANNVLLDTSDPNNPTVLIKLYEPLPNDFNLKSELWVVESIASPLSYQIDATLIFDNLDDNISLKGPNFNISTKDRINNSTEYTNFNTLTNTTSQYGSSSLRYQLNSLLVEKGLEINIDYNDYSNFVFFSSAQTRLENFYYKMSLLEEYTANAKMSSTGSSSTSYYVSSSYSIYQAKIDDIITNFDGYEYFLYFESGDKCWPKTNDEQPYINATVNSLQVQNWLNEQYANASNYDNNLNPNALINTIPSYLRDDPSNSQYELFVEMVGQHFDSIWVYIKDIDNKYNADNRLDYGVSKDLVADVLRDLGVKIYQNNFSVDDLYTSFIGITPGGSSLPPTGSELITNYVTASLSPYVLPGYVITGYVNGKPIIVPLDDINKSIYKRIYHNVPYLFKKKGTIEGLRALITLYGIPDTILRISEFGGKNKDNSNDWDQWQNQYNYSLYSSLVNNYSSSESGSVYGSGTYGTSVYTSTSNKSGVVIIPWDKLSTTNVSPSSIAFRFKTEGIPTLYPSQSLLFNELSLGGNAFSIVLEHSESIYGTYSGSGASISPTYNWGTLKLILPDTSVSCSVYLPLFNEGWWSVLVTRTNSTHSLYVKNKINNGDDGNQLGFQASSSVISSNPSWYNVGNSYLGGYRPGVTSSLISGKIYTPYIGTFQEFRYYSIPLNESTFDDFVMNPYSIEGNTTDGSQSSLEILKLRAPLGSILDIDVSQSARTSVHPSLTVVPTTSSFYNGTNNYTITGSFQFISNTETIFLDQFPAGIRNIINNKIKIAQTILPAGDTLSPYIRIQQDSSVSGSYTKDLNLLEVAFSPQNEINEDIIAQLGYFNLGDYIGDPRQLAQSKDFYPDLNTLRDEYFKKYTSNYNLTDYIRLIKYFDNSLFKMIKDFVPARTSLSSGIVIKQHLLERNRYRVPSASYSEPYYTASVKSFPFDFNSSQLYKTTAAGAGEFDSVYIDSLNQAWSESIVTPLGIVNRIHNDKSEFLTGELSGSTIVVTTQSLGPIPVPFKVNLTDVINTNLNIVFNSNIYTFNPDKKYYVQFTVTNTDTSYNTSVLAYWNTSTFQTLWESGIVLPQSSEISPFIDITTLPTITFGLLNQSSLLFSEYNPNTSVTTSIYEVDNTQYDPLLNNATEARLSTKYMDIDYSSGQLSPTNQGVLITGSATKAPVQDYNWNVRRSTLPRYAGSKLTGAKINVHTDGDISYGKEPVINNYQTSFLTFKEIRNAYPELVGKSTLWINSLVDKDGNQLAVDFSTGSNYYYNLIDNFGKDSQVNLQITTLPSGSDQTDLDQSTTVYRPALLWPKVILTNESGSNYSLNYPRWTTGSLGLAFYETFTTSSIISKVTVTSLQASWSFGASSRNILTASNGLAEIIWESMNPTTPGSPLGEVNSPFQYPLAQDITTASYGGVGGYDTPIPLIIKRGQEIRFLQNEDYTYVITQVDARAIPGDPPMGIPPTYRCHLYLDRPLATGLSNISSNINNINRGYLIREYQVDPTKLVINAPKLVGGASGYLTPQYMSPDLIANLDKTVETLKENGIL